MKRTVAATAMFLLLPSLAMAAGFANQAIFLSKSPVTEGDSVRIYATVDNESSVNFAGNVVISDGDASLGTTSVSLAAGGAQTVSIGWTPAAGTHTITAQLVGSDGSVAETQSAKFTIQPKPQPAATTTDTAAAVQSSTALQQDIANYSPQAATISQPIFSTIDSVRNSAAGALDGQISNAQQNLAKTPSPFDSNTSVSEGGLSVPNTTNDFWWVLWTIYLYALEALQFLIGNAALFYPVFVIVIFYLLYRTYRFARRPRY